MSLLNQPQKSQKPDPATKYKQGKNSYKDICNMLLQGIEKSVPKGKVFLPLDKEGYPLTTGYIDANEFMELMEKQRLASTPPTYQPNNLFYVSPRPYPGNRPA